MRGVELLGSGLLLAGLFAGALASGDAKALASTPREQTVTGALADVFTSFGEIASSLYKVTLSSDTSEGRGKMGKMAVPLIVGFKIAGAIVAALTALKVLVIKTMAMSSIALLASAGVAAKYVYDKMQAGKHASDLPQAVPYYYAPVQEMAWDSSYDVSGGHIDESASLQSSSDLQGHYSSQVTQTSAANNQSSYTFIPGAPAAQRKILRGSRPYKTTIYKTVHRMND